MMKLRTWRVDEELRQEDLRQKLGGMRLNRLSKIERGEVWPSPTEIAVIARVTRNAVTVTDHYETWMAAHPGAANDACRALSMVG